MSGLLNSSPGHPVVLYRHGTPTLSGDRLLCLHKKEGCWTSMDLPRDCARSAIWWLFKILRAIERTKNRNRRLETRKIVLSTYTL